MSFDRPFRSRQASSRNKASQKLRNRRLHVENLERRDLMAGLADLLANSPEFLGESEGPAQQSPTDPKNLDEDRSLKYLPTSYYVAKQGEFLTGPASGDALEIAIGYMRSHANYLGITATDVNHLIVTNRYTDSLGVTHIYFQQTFDNLPIANSEGNVSVTKNGEIVSLNGKFVGNLQYPAQEQTLSTTKSSIESFQQFAKDTGYTLSNTPTVISPSQGRDQRTVISGGGITASNVTARLRYIATPNGLELTWNLNAPLSDFSHWYDLYQSGSTGKTIAVSDWTDKATYNVFGIPSNGPIDGSRTRVVNPQDPIASPYGWHDVNGLPGADFNDTRGNNVWAQEDRDGNAVFVGQTPVPRPNGGTNLDFDFPLNLNAASTAAFTEASTVNLFYLANVAHDVTYRYGFDEVSGNFQSLNYSQTGGNAQLSRGGDPVLALTQIDANLPGLLAQNNAFMATPPDGFQPVLAMFEFNIDLQNVLRNGTLAFYAPRRDGSFATDIVLHEYFHGVTNRLTGGPANASGLNALQSASMGEGWSDFFGLWMTQLPTDGRNTANEIATYVNGPNPVFPGRGIRRFPYSFDMAQNPLTFGDFNLAGSIEVHDAGEIWCSILWDMNVLLRDKYGFSSDRYSGQGGNNLAFQLVMDALKLQPANPTWTQARDAILKADLIRNRGVNHKEIWTAFARRGMGLTADSDTLDLGAQLGIGTPIVFVDSPNSPFVQEKFDLPQPEGRIRGRVFADANGNGVLDGNEVGIAGATVFLDVDNDGVYEPLEPTTTTAADGSYEFEIYARGDYRVGQVLAAGVQQTFPPGIGGNLVTVSGNPSIIADVNFGNRTGNPASSGIVFNDLDGDSRQDEDEPGLAGVYVYADYDGDKRQDLGEPAVQTDANGNYKLMLDRQGTYFVRQLRPAGFRQTFPTNDAGHSVTIANGTLNAVFQFGNTTAEDWGDAPNSYLTTAASGGAVHGMLPGFFLGASMDLESDGQPSATANGDDNPPTVTDKDDEDGITFTSTIFPGSTSTLNVTVNLKERVTQTIAGKEKTVVVQDNSGGRLNAWVDFNRDGDFDTDEKIFSDLYLGEGTHALSFATPRTAAPGISFARFRYGYEHNLGPSGRSLAGEVEDYQVRILSDQPDANDDVFSVDQNSIANPLDVLVNDVASAKGPLTIITVTSPTRGTAVIAPDGLSVRYTPAAGAIGNDSFSYTVRDPAGATDRANVSITILPALAAPKAVDDSFTVNENSTNNTLDVLVNDLTGRRPPIGIVFPGSPANGLVSLDTRGTTSTADDVLKYTPNPGFFGTDQFQYTIEDSLRQQSTATVTVHVNPRDLDDDIVQYRLEVTDINGRPIQAIGVGETFKIRGYVKDLRLTDGVPDLPADVDRRGVGAAYFDVLFPYSLLSLQSPISFQNLYTNATSGNTATPGLIDEVGALRNADPPLGADMLFFEVTARATGVGTANFIGDPADRTSESSGGLSPDHDTGLYEPAVTVGFRQQRFVNTSLQIVGSGGRPIAVDNTFTLPLNSINFPLAVLANDVDLTNPPLSISAVGTATSTSFTTANGGNVTISPDGLLLLYTPRNGFSGTEQFTYTVKNAVNLTSSAMVTVQVGAAPKDLTIRLVATNLQGQLLTGPINIGDDFNISVLVQDIRTTPPDANRMGVFAAYTDLLFDGKLVSTIGDLNNPFGFQVAFGPDYGQNGLSADRSIVNLINEAGAFQSSFGPLGPSERLLMTVTFNADKPGTATFQSDPAELTPLHDVLFFEPDDAKVPLSRINFRSTTVTIVGAVPEGEPFSQFTNRQNRFDVNGDQYTSPIDPLLVINILNSSSTGSGEAEAAGSPIFPDVNGDGQVSPIDALRLINFLNEMSTGTSEGEAAPLVLPSSFGSTGVNVLNVEARGTRDGQKADTSSVGDDSWSDQVDAMFAAGISTEVTTRKRSASQLGNLLASDPLDPFADLA